MRTGSFGKRKSCFPIVVEFEQFGAEHPPIFIFVAKRLTYHLAKTTMTRIGLLAEDFAGVLLNIG